MSEQTEAEQTPAEFIRRISEELGTRTKACAALHGMTLKCVNSVRE
jgi:hypothetical protein